MISKKGNHPQQRRVTRRWLSRLVPCVATESSRMMNAYQTTQENVVNLSAQWNALILADWQAPSKRKMSRAWWCWVTKEKKQNLKALHKFPGDFLSPVLFTETCVKMITFQLKPNKETKQNTHHSRKLPSPTPNFWQKKKKKGKRLTTQRLTFCHMHFLLPSDASQYVKRHTRWDEPKAGAVRTARCLVLAQQSSCFDAPGAKRAECNFSVP